MASTIEGSAAAIIGFETVQHVSNIYKYYVAMPLDAKNSPSPIATASIKPQ